MNKILTTTPLSLVILHKIYNMNQVMKNEIPYSKKNNINNHLLQEFDLPDIENARSMNYMNE